MKAIAYETYGSADVLELKDVRQPEVGPNQVLVRVRAASANPYDWHFMRGLPYAARLTSMGIHKPKISILGAANGGYDRATGPARRG